MNEIDLYINCLLKEYDGCDVNTFIDTAAEDISAIYLSKIEEENEEILENEKENDDQEVEDEEKPHSTITSIIHSERHLVVLGNPGSGKTTVLLHELVHLGKGFLAGTSQIIPIFVPLKELREDYTLSDALSPFQSSPALHDFMKKGDSVLFLDGLNEVNQNIYDQTVREIQGFIEHYPLLHVVITSRKYGYSNQFGIPQYEILAFDHLAIKDYTIRRTHDSRLYYTLMKRGMVHSLASTPLMLKMITDIWEDSHSLPVGFSTLYREFVDYQLTKSLKVSEKDRICLLEVFAKLAFELRNFGFISDSVEHLKEIISGYVDSEQGDRVGDELLKSGLLVINSLGHGYDYVSFIHETFQEYFCSLYIAEYYIKNHIFPVDVTSGIWKEAIKLAIEMILPELDRKATGLMLNQLRMAFYSKSENHMVDEYLQEFVGILSDSFVTSPYVHSYLEQYVAMNMQNYINSDVSARLIDLFQIIVYSVGMLKNSQLYRNFFDDERWLNEWLFSKDEMEPGQSTKSDMLRNKKFALFKHSLNYTCHPKDYFIAVLDLQRNYSYNVKINKRLSSLIGLLTRILSNEDMKKLYQQNGWILCLLFCMDVEFIESELTRRNAQLSDIEGPFLFWVAKKYSSSNKLSTICYYYNHIVPRYQDLSPLKPYFLKDLVNHPGLLDGMLDSDYWQRRIRFLAQIVFLLPEHYWTEKYCSLISEQIKHNGTFTALAHTKFKRSINLQLEDKLGDNYLYVFDKNKTKDANDIEIALNEMTKSEVNEVIYVGVLELLSCLGSSDYFQEWKFGDFDSIMEKYPILRITEVDGHSTIWFKLSKVIGPEFCKNYVQIGDEIYKVSRDRRVYISTPLKLHSLEYEKQAKKRALDKDRLMASYCFAKRDMFMEHKDLFNPFTGDHLATLGILGYFPDKFHNRIKKDKSNLFNVIGKANSIVKLVGYKGNNILKIPHSFYEEFEVGDILLYYNDTYFKLHNIDNRLDYGFLGGIVIAVDSTEVRIREADRHRVYIVENKDGRFNIGDHVSFWPTFQWVGNMIKAYSIGLLND